MKLDQQQQAQRLYFQTDLSKSEIAHQAGISRSTLHAWIREHNWERLKKSGEFIPSFLAENCYHILGNLTEHLLSEDRVGEPATVQEVNAVYKLVLTINKLKNKATLNETMEAFTWFSEDLDTKNPELAAQVKPYIEDYIAAHAQKNMKEHRPAKIEANGFIPNTGLMSTSMEDHYDKDDQNVPEIPESLTKEPAPVTANPRSALSSPSEKKNSFREQIMKELRGTATSGPGKNRRQNRQKAA